MNEKYFTERLFWMPDTNALLHVYFMHGHGWHCIEIFEPHSFYVSNHTGKTYAELMSHFSHRSPELLLQEEW